MHNQVDLDHKTLTFQFFISVLLSKILPCLDLHDYIEVTGLNYLRQESVTIFFFLLVNYCTGGFLLIRNCENFTGYNR